MVPQNGCGRVISLVDIALETLARNADRILISLQGVPEELVIRLFESIVQKGKLTPRILEIMERTEHEDLVDLIQSLNISK